MSSRIVSTTVPRQGVTCRFRRSLAALSSRMLLGLLCVSGLAGRLPAAEVQEDPRDFLMMKLHEAALKTVQTRMEAATGTPTPEPGSGSVTSGPAYALPDYGCALWLEVARSTNNTGNVVVTLHNTIPGTNYQILSKTNLNDVNWPPESHSSTAWRLKFWSYRFLRILGCAAVSFMACVFNSHAHSPVAHQIGTRPRTFWTVQEYALEETVWATWVAQIRLLQ